jgi:hypothetical protein
MSPHFVSKTRDKVRSEIQVEKPALAECAMSLASTLLLGCQTRGEFASRDSRTPAQSRPVAHLRRTRVATVSRKA